MGLFHKTLKNAEDRIRHNDYAAAENIIKEHIEDEHSIDSEFNLLSTAYHKYQEDLRQLITILSVRQQPNRNIIFGNEIRKKAIERIQSAEEHLNTIETHGKSLAKKAKHEN